VARDAVEKQADEPQAEETYETAQNRHGSDGQARIAARE
jgi:hypothetical protein